MRALVSVELVYVSLPPYFQNTNTSLCWTLCWNPRIYVITLFYSGYVYVMYCFAIITYVMMPHDDLSETNCHCLRAGCHTNHASGCTHSLSWQWTMPATHTIGTQTPLLLGLSDTRPVAHKCHLLLRAIHARWRTNAYTVTYVVLLRCDLHCSATTCSFTLDPDITPMWSPSSDTNCWPIPGASFWSGTSIPPGWANGPRYGPTLCGYFFFDKVNCA
jgi:hypothetical protein